MNYPSIDKLLNQVGSKYLLVNLAAKRAKEMAITNYYQMPEKEYHAKKNIGKSLEEIANDLIEIIDKE